MAFRITVHHFVVAVFVDNFTFVYIPASRTGGCIAFFGVLKLSFGIMISC